MGLARALLAVGLLVPAVWAQEDATCYSAEALAGILFATILLTVIVAVLLVAGLIYRGLLRVQFGRESKPGQEKFAFDNPFFKQDEDRAERGHATGLQETKARSLAGFKFPKSLTHIKKSSSPRKSQDDSNLPPEIVFVPLKGRDFTGLGFKIWGNMREGIYVRDVLNRGPANESGTMKAGDKILSLTVSFVNMVYDDALTILSYASPYDVQIELEKNSDMKKTMTSPKSKRLIHPIYRSQSTDQINITGIKESNGFISKRSQSAVVTPGLKHGSIKSFQNSPISLNRTIIANEVLNTSLSSEIVDPIIEIVKISPPLKPMQQDVISETCNVETSKASLEKSEDTIDSSQVSITSSESEKDEPPQIIPRTKGTPGKRKAPSPPNPSNGMMIKTKAQVHQEQTLTDSTSLAEVKNIDDSCADVDSLETMSVEQRSLSEISNDSLENVKPDKRSSSLGDLEKLEETKHSLFERATSLDLHQQTILPSPLNKEFLQPSTVETELKPNGKAGNSPRIKKWIVKENLNNSDESVGNDTNNNSVLENIMVPRLDPCAEEKETDIVEEHRENIDEFTKTKEELDSSLEQKSSEDNFEEISLTKSSEEPGKSKEVIEISEGELDDIMMSHKQYLWKQAKVTGVYPSKKSEEKIEFESWCYQEESKKNGALSPAALDQIKEIKQENGD